MTQDDRSGLPGELYDIARTKAPQYNEPPAVIRRRKIMVGVVLLVGGSLLGYSLSRPPEDATFIWLTLALAAVWALGDCSEIVPAAVPAVPRTAQGLIYVP